MLEHGSQPDLSRLVEELVEIGLGDADRFPPSAPDTKSFWSAIAVRHRALYELANTIPIPHLDSLIRGLVRASRADRSRNLGSVSPVVRLLRTLSARDRRAEEQLTPWIIMNRVNLYEPFGRHAGATVAKTLSELAEREARAAHLRAVQLDERLAQKQVEREDRNREHATRQLWNAVRRGDLLAVKALLDMGAQPVAATRDGQSLRSLALEHGRHQVAEYLQEQGIESMRH